MEWETHSPNGFQKPSEDEFFKKFDEKNLAFLYQDTTSSGEQSRFFKFVSRETEEDKSSKKH